MHSRNILLVMFVVILVIPVTPVAALAMGETVPSPTPNTYFVNNSEDSTLPCTVEDCSLRAAIIAANERPGTDIIELPAGHYSLTIPGRFEDEGHSGDLDISEALVIIGQDRVNTVVNANGIDRVFHLTRWASVKIKNISISGGLSSCGGGIFNETGILHLVNSAVGGNIVGATGDPMDAVCDPSWGDEVMLYTGGGILNNGEMTIISSVISDNTADPEGDLGAGGGLLNTSDAIVSLVKTTISDNRAAMGGGVWNAAETAVFTRNLFLRNDASYKGGAVYNQGSLDISGGTISDNQAHQGGGVFNEAGLNVSRVSIAQNRATRNFGDGGAFFNGPDGIVEITGSQISQNEAHYFGGGISNAGTLRLIDSSVNGNFIQYKGGGIYNNGVLELEACHLLGNDTWNYGGGLSNDAVAEISDSTFRDNYGWTGGGVDNAGDLVINGSTFAENYAEQGGALSNSQILMATNSTISHNQAGYSGGGLENAGSMSLHFVTINENIAQEGGGIYTYSLDPVPAVVNLQGTLVSNNTQLGSTDCSGAIQSGGYNLDSDGSCGLDSSGDLIGQPLLGPLEDNGGSTSTHALQAGSPAIDAASHSICPATDQRGALRPADGDGDGVARCDIGSFERQS